jgi:uncharacterized protein (DUF924 family)
VKPGLPATLMGLALTFAPAVHHAADGGIRHGLAQAEEVVSFWRDAGPAMWFAKSPDFDRRFRERFSGLYTAAKSGALEHWLESANASLALIILLDQYPRNSFRGTPQMYATDADARRAAGIAIAAGHDRTVEPAMQVFMYLPFGHSESLADQDRAVALTRRLGEPNLSHAQRHRDIIREFGRFPHRNPILGRTMRPEEQRYLDNGGFSG